MNCGICANQLGCWERGEKTALVNLLVCRIQEGIHKNTSTKQLLELLDPKIRSVARHVAQRTKQQTADVIPDVQHFIVLTLLQDYRLGDPILPLPWLFHPRFGAVKAWSQKYITEYFRSEPLHEEPVAMAEAEEEDEDIDYTRIEQILEDGVTLNSLEYRILSLCLTTGQSIGKLNHPWISQHIGRSRQEVTQLYQVARIKILRALRSAPTRSADQVRAAVQRQEISVVEAAVELGVSVRWAYQLRSSDG